ncbi:substrate-binding domain-containing protein [Paeniglutamicibacter sp. ZC-3]|uniref:substrate-binding domain-containing protein n=1 Tax=Paeniglutamicibacter sp. ZC-3 TaxID=2986919 RepID=UPI0021F75783|nr:substrate-binding domain-containing protein [Paeniglutamicibacter sp. ZC-3]MCV9996191.1 substrate-binding domain-containing protein [Paeniglutamicibacter sp. ZC-3]
MAFTVAMVLPFQGPGGIYGPSAEAITELAVSEINADGGVLGDQINTIMVDGGAPRSQVHAEVSRLLTEDKIQAVSGWHISSVRNALAPLVAGRIPYLYPSLYEGGEQRSGVYCTGEVPSNQLEPAMRWLRNQQNVRKWFVVGDNYVWPRQTYAALKDRVTEQGIEFVGSSFIEGSQHIDTALDSISKSSCEGVLMLLVGHNAAVFNRAFSARGLHEKMIRLSPLMEENTLLASGSEATVGIFSTAAYFRSLVTMDAMDLMSRYHRRQGVTAPMLNSPAESCYEALYGLRHLVDRAGSSNVKDIDAKIDGTAFSAGRGTVVFEGNQLRQPLYLAEADGLDFDVVATL